MGAPWRDHPAWEIVERVEAALGEQVAPLLLDASAEDLARTREAQLAVLTTSLVAWTAVKDRLPTTPVAFAGHSLGQVTALIAAGALSLEDGVRLAARRAEVTQAAADRNPGRLAAVLGLETEDVEKACAQVAEGCWVANDNAPGQVVIGGTPQGVEAGTQQAKAAGAKRVMPLNVGGAFHTPLMDEARAAFAVHLAATAFNTPTSPVVSNVDATAYSDADGWPQRLAEQLVSPVRWRSTQRTLVDLGATEFVEVGAGSTLAGLAKRTVPGVPVRNVAVPADIAALTEVR